MTPQEIFKAVSKTHRFEIREGRLRVIKLKGMPALSKKMIGLVRDNEPELRAMVRSHERADADWLAIRGHIEDSWNHAHVRTIYTARGGDGSRLLEDDERGLDDLIEAWRQGPRTRELLQRLKTASEAHPVVSGFDEPEAS